ncbi:MAG: response regulator transcription factor [Chloroflexi bacterium]|nr:response regulator transcription factor [Chloroflexota bacterium]MCI0801224.1 response regulator transcription factor [Chloroflexota bacterium]MCI0811083.1 response regulator transcription factor [Chloroflexota bacterium]MCI0863486.1 response regulator transcription factor [Chloroflexota bacterium]
MASDQPKKILVIEDDEDIRTVVVARLTRAGYETTVAFDGKDGLRRFYGDRPDLVVLDIAMPVMDGWQVLERLREVSEVPVLILTAATQERDKLRGLRSGADDYITKPFSGEELLARIEVALRRASSSAEEAETTGYSDLEIAIDFQKHEVFVRGEPIALSPTEFRLLAALTRSANQVLSQEQLLDQVWGSEYVGSLEVVRLYVGYLRRKIERNHEVPALIETVRGFGYRYRRPTA